MKGTFKNIVADVSMTRKRITAQNVSNEDDLTVQKFASCSIMWSFQEKHFNMLSVWERLVREAQVALA